MAIKFFILSISLILMFAIIGLSIAGYFWAADKATPPPVGGRVVLVIAAGSAGWCLWRLWTTRHDHIR
ncbi:MAG: hypothetical protein DHS20C15_11860 [Planctomycetota bacterium]|nr:MAG: hypothetical protein DHS20C15_11860 [Planctomycetota bacterium]